MNGMFKIGLVEDNEVNRRMIMRRLSKQGFQVVTAVDGRDAVTMAERELPDLILMDLDLPIMSGTEAALTIRSNPVLSTIPIIALTAHAMLDDAKDVMAVGCDECVTKPVDFTFLLAKIQELRSARFTVHRS